MRHDVVEDGGRFALALIADRVHRQECRTAALKVAVVGTQRRWIEAVAAVRNRLVPLAVPSVKTQGAAQWIEARRGGCLGHGSQRGEAFQNQGQGFSSVE